MHELLEEDVEKRWKGDADRIRNEKRKIKRHLETYIGETSWSVFEHALEHQNDVDQLKPSSPMLRHILEMHEDEERSKVEFGMMVLR